MPTHKPTGYWGYQGSRDGYYRPSPATLSPLLVVAVLVAILLAVLAAVWPLL